MKTFKLTYPSGATQTIELESEEMEMVLGAVWGGWLLALNPKLALAHKMLTALFQGKVEEVIS